MSDSDPNWALRVVLRAAWLVAGIPAVAILWGLDRVHAPWWITTAWISAYLGVGGLLFGREGKGVPTAARPGKRTPPAP